MTKFYTIIVACAAMAIFGCKKQSSLSQPTDHQMASGGAISINTLGDAGTYINNSSEDVAGFLNSYDPTNPSMPQVVNPSVYQIGSTYHLFGIEVNAAHKFVALKHYTSTDLLTWTFQSNLLADSVQDYTPGHTGQWIKLPVANAGRPSLLIKASAGPQKYILMYKRSNTATGSGNKDEAAFFTSANLTGPYVYRNVIRSVDWLDGSTPRVSDGLGGMGLYQEDSNGASYFLCTFSPTIDTPYNNNGNSIRRLDMSTLNLTGSLTSQADYRQVILATATQEAPRVFKRAGYYYWVTSQTAGWNSSTTQYRAKSGTALLDNSNVFSDILTMPTSPTWSYDPKVHDTTTTKAFSFDTQHSCIVPINNTVSGTEFVYYGDRWTGYSDRHGLMTHTLGGYNGIYPMIFRDSTGEAPIPVICAPGFDYNGGDWIPLASTGKWNVYNTVQDGAFEDAFASYWTVSGTTGIASVGTGGRTGKALIIAGTATANTTITAINSLQLPTGTYSVKFWYKSNAAASNCKKTISVLKYSGATLTSTTKVLNFPVTTSYQQKTSMANVSINAENDEHLLIQIVNTGDGTLYIDDMTVDRIVP